MGAGVPNGPGRDLAAEVERLELALERAHGELDELIQLAGHDLMAPLRTVRMFLDLLLTTQGEDLDAKARQYLAHCVTAAEQGERLVRGLQDYAQVESRGQPLVATPLGPVAAAAAAQVRGALEAAGGRLELGELPTWSVDGKQIQALLGLLLDNAVANRGSRPLVVQVRGRRAEDDGLRIEVEDNGRGIPEERREAAFAPFKRVHSTGQVDGAGLGLAVARRIAARHGGELTLVAAPGGGCLFCLSLPGAGGG